MALSLSLSLYSAATVLSYTVVIQRQSGNSPNHNGESVLRRRAFRERLSVLSRQLAPSVLRDSSLILLFILLILARGQTLSGIVSVVSPCYVTFKAGHQPCCRNPVTVRPCTLPNMEATTELARWTHPTII